MKRMITNGWNHRDIVIQKENEYYLIEKENDDAYWLCSISCKDHSYSFHRLLLSNNQLSELALDGLEKDCIHDIGYNGERWEGDLCQGQLFGYGKLFDADGYLCYKGLMIQDRKEIFGEEYYPQTDVVEYRGMFYRNKRHGFGELSRLERDSYWKLFI